MTRFRLPLALAFIVLGSYCITTSFAERNGITGRSRVGCGGGCHGISASSATTVKIWTDSAQLHTGQTYLFHISVINASTTTKAGGCDISVDNSAKLGTSGSGLFLSSGELTHTTPKTKSGDSITWTFTYTPKNAGTSHIYAGGNAVNLNNREDAGDQWNLTTFTATVTPPPGPSIALPASVHDTVALGSTASADVWIKNLGTAPLAISSFALKGSAAWSVTDSSKHSVAVGDSIDVKLNLAPTAYQAYTDTLYIYSNDVLTPTAKVPLLGMGATARLTLDSLNLNFGSLQTGASKTLRMVIRNSGNLPLTISNIAVQSNTGAYSFINSRAFPITVKPGSSAADTFKFAPTAEGLDTASVVLTYTEISTAKQSTIALSGVASSNLSVATEPQAKFVVTPNPSNGSIAIISTTSSAASVEVLDERGRTLASNPQITLSDARLDLSSLPNGSYFLRVEPKEGAAIMRRIVIQH